MRKIVTTLGIIAAVIAFCVVPMPWNVLAILAGNCVCPVYDCVRRSKA